MEAKIGGRTLSQGWKKNQSSTFQFDSELRRLNCLISYEGSFDVARRGGKNNWDLVLVD